MLLLEAFAVYTNLPATNHWHLHCFNHVAGSSARGTSPTGITKIKRAVPVTSSVANTWWLWLLFCKFLALWGQKFWSCSCFLQQDPHLWGRKTIRWGGGGYFQKFPWKQLFGRKCFGHTTNNENGARGDSRIKRHSYQQSTIVKAAFCGGSAKCTVLLHSMGS